MKRTRCIWVLSILLAVTPAWAQANREGKDAKIVFGGKAHQILLKDALDRQLTGTLVADLNQNSQVWKSLNADQLRELRERYYAFLRQNPDQQAALLEATKEFHNLTADQREAYQKRSEWLTRVVESLTPAQREELKAMTPEERAKRLLELKAKLVDGVAAPVPQPAK